MSAQERLAAFRQVLAEASARYGVRLAVVQQLGAVILDEPALGYVLLDQSETFRGSPVSTVSGNAVSADTTNELPLSACGEGVGGEVRTVPEQSEDDHDTT